MPSFGTSAEFSRVVNSTHAKFFRTEEKNILMKRRFTALLMEKGRIKLNESGDEMKWPVRYKRTGLSVLGDTNNISFQRKLKDKVAKLPWIGYYVEDAQGRKEELMNKGKEAILKQSSLIMERLKDDIKDGFGLELYKDGNSGSNTGRISGLETCLAGAVAGANNKTYAPLDSYAGHSTVPRTIGSYTGNYPDGSGDAHYEWWSPVIVDSTGTGWQASTKTFPNTAVECLRYGINAAQRTTDPLDLVLLRRSAYTDFQEKLDSRERIITERSGNNSLLVKLGFGSVINFEGVDHTFEEGVETGDSAVHGYGMSLDKIDLCCLQDQLFKPDPVDYSNKTLQKEFLVTMWGQLRLNPRHLVKFTS